MDEEYYSSGNEKYATIGNDPAQPWEILPIWLYLVSLATLTLSLSNKKNKKLTIPTDSPPLSLRRPPSLRPLPLQTHPPSSLSLQPMARMQRPGSAPIRTRQRPSNHRPNSRRTLNPLLRRVQRRDPLRGGHAGALCQ
jgi:hypothetical protein